MYRVLQHTTQKNWMKSVSADRHYSYHTCIIHCTLMTHNFKNFIKKYYGSINILYLVIQILQVNILIYPYNLCISTCTSMMKEYTKSKIIQGRSLCIVYNTSSSGLRPKRLTWSIYRRFQSPSSLSWPWQLPRRWHVPPGSLTASQHPPHPPGVLPRGQRVGVGQILPHLRGAGLEQWQGARL